VILRSKVPIPSKSQKWQKVVLIPLRIEYLGFLIKIRRSGIGYPNLNLKVEIIDPNQDLIFVAIFVIMTGLEPSILGSGVEYSTTVLLGHYQGIIHFLGL
jgi:hypothetical protein